MTNPTRDGSAVKLKTTPDEPSAKWEDPLNHARDNLAWYLMKIERSLGHLNVPAGFRGTLLGIVGRAFGGDSGEGEDDPRLFASRESIGIIGGCSESSVRNWRKKFTRRQALRVAPRAGGGVIFLPPILRRVPQSERKTSRRANEYEVDFRALEAFCIQLDKMAAEFRSLNHGARAKRLTENEQARALHGFTEGVRAMCGRGPRERYGARAANAIAKGLSALAGGAGAANLKPAAARREEPTDLALRDEWVRRLGDGECSPLTPAHREQYFALIADGNEPADAATLALGVAAELDKPEAEPESAAEAQPAPRLEPSEPQAKQPPPGSEPDPETAAFIEDLVGAGMTPREAVDALLKARNVRQEQTRTGPLSRGLESLQMNGALAMGSRPMLD